MFLVGLGCVVLIFLIGLVWPVIRFFGAIIILALIFGSILSPSPSTASKPYDYTYYKDMSYQELYDFPNDCSLKNKQLSILKQLQQSKSFDPDPDKLSPADKDYNGRLKATIWWYAYRCEK
jgi:hypothetical protein